jgi:hypothetical protein
MEEDEMDCVCGTFGLRVQRNTYRILVGKPEGKRAFGRSRLGR